MTAAIEVRAVEKRFGNVGIIRDLNLSVAQGERHAIIGFDSQLRAERIVLPGYGHAVQRHPDFNDRLADFVERASA